MGTFLFPVSLVMMGWYTKGHGWKQGDSGLWNPEMIFQGFADASAWQWLTMLLPMILSDNTRQQYISFVQDTPIWAPIPLRTQTRPGPTPNTNPLNRKEPRQMFHPPDITLLCCWDSIVYLYKNSLLREFYVLQYIWGLSFVF